MRAGVKGAVMLALLVGSALPSRRALADAVPPAPDDCPKGQKGVTSHRGPECCRPNGKCDPREDPRLVRREPEPDLGLPDPTPTDVPPPKPVDSPLPAEPSRPERGGGCQKGCSTSPEPEPLTWLALPLLLGALLRRRATAQR